MAADTPDNRSKVNAPVAGSPAGQSQQQGYKAPSPDEKETGIVAIGLKYRNVVLLIVTVLVLFGIYALKEMNKNEFPSFTVREGLVVAVCPGADATQMENEVLKKLEDPFPSWQ